MSGREAYVLDAVRTPFGRYGGALATVRPDDLAARVLGALLARSPSVDPADVDEVVLGNANGAVTAGNSSPLSDGASAVLVGSASAAARAGTEPLARIAARAAVGVDPDVFGTGPVRAAETALARAGIGWGDVARVELNEAFAAQSLACLDSWPDLDPALVNPDGGAIALGHPLGASGGRVLAQLVHGLRATGGGWGLASLCVGVGQGVAVVVEVPATGRVAL